MNMWFVGTIQEHPGRQCGNVLFYHNSECQMFELSIGKQLSGSLLGLDCVHYYWIYLKKKKEKLWGQLKSLRRFYVNWDDFEKKNPAQKHHKNKRNKQLWNGQS